MVAGTCSRDLSWKLRDHGRKVPRTVHPKDPTPSDLLPPSKPHHLRFYSWAGENHQASVDKPANLIPGTHEAQLTLDVLCPLVYTVAYVCSGTNT